MLVCLEDEYRQQREEQRRKDIGSIDRFNVQLPVSEEAPPWIIDGGKPGNVPDAEGAARHTAHPHEFLTVDGEWEDRLRPGRGIPCGRPARRLQTRRSRRST